ncbi:MAG: ATP-binding protein [Elusimicrobia bacterium]|nr:ATP-binding protein [Elusimicrobiota bacterium]
MWIAREIEHTIKKIASQRPVLIVTGCRQAGKTSLLKQLFAKANYISLDVPAVAQEAEESGEGFLAKYSAPLVVDEVQYAPKLLRYIKKEVDRNRERSGLYYLTGSQKFSLMQGVTESLAGRAAILELYSLSARELESFSGHRAEGNQLAQWIFKGGYPEIYARDLDPQRFFSDYLVTYLERDVRQALQVRNLRDFDRFMRLAAVRTGQLLSLNSFASDLGLSPNTIKSWLSVLEASNIIYLLEPYYRNLGKRIVKTPKLYFLDTGLACYLAGIRTTAELTQSALLGAIFETHVLGQMIRRDANRGRRSSIFFYRDHYGHEIDFVIPVGEKLKLIEAKWAESYADTPKGFKEIAALTGQKNILTQSVVTALRGPRKLTGKNLWLDDTVELRSLETGA